jgi:two-component system chemotaxis response regulator CheV
MAGILEGVDLRTQMAGRNRMELLLFRITGRQRYGINVFKVREVLECPPLRRVPGSHPAVRGMAHIRGRTFPIIDLGHVLGRKLPENAAGLSVVVTEFNRSVQGFLVSGVDRILNMNWETVMPPPGNMGNVSYLTAVTRIDNELIEIIDVEKILTEVAPYGARLEITLPPEALVVKSTLPVLVADDSSTARKMISKTLDKVGIPYIMATNGREALQMLKDMAAEGKPMGARLGMVVSDIEMPEMDGYTLTTEIKKDPALKDLYVMLHSSLSGVFNDAMVRKVGADKFLAKFNSDDFAKLILEIINQTAGASARAA